MMSLIKCMDCGKEYSSNAESCPKCGCPTIETLNEICKRDKCIIICHEAYDVSEILSNIENGVDDQVSIEAIASSIGENTTTSYCILQEIKDGNFLPWIKNEHGLLTNPKYQIKINQRNAQRSNPNTPHCPTCNSTNIKKIGIAGKASILGLGLLSSDIRKQFRCKDCGYKW